MWCNNHIFFCLKTKVILINASKGGIHRSLFQALPKKPYIFKDLGKKVPFWLFFYVQATAFSI